VKTLLADIANVHSGALTHCLQTLEDLDILRRIFLLVFHYFFLIGTHILLYLYILYKTHKDT
jgi:hypothetical protein